MNLISEDRIEWVIITGLLAFLLIVAYRAVRSKFKIVVNCWFCNENMKVPYDDENNWTCCYCQQYNGFTKDGDYNADIYQKFQSENFNNMTVSNKNHKILTSEISENALCDTCNRQQEIKIRKLASFDVDLDCKFDTKLEHFKKKLEEEYILCSTCNFKVKRILNEKKKLIFLYKSNFDLKRAKDFTKPKRNFFSRRTMCREFCSILVLTCSAIVCLESIWKLVVKTDSLKLTFLGNVVNSATFPIPFIKKAVLFFRSSMWLFGFKMHNNFPTNSSILFSGISLGNTLIIFVVNILDGFKVTRYTYLLIFWSLYVAGRPVIQTTGELYENIMKLILSILTVTLCLPTKKWLSSSCICLDNVATNFHRIPVENYFKFQEEARNNKSNTQENQRVWSGNRPILSDNHLVSSKTPLNFEILSRKLQLQNNNVNNLEPNNNKENWSDRGNSHKYMNDFVSPNSNMSNIQLRTRRKSITSSIHHPFRMLNMTVSRESNERANKMYFEPAKTNKSLFYSANMPHHNLILPSRLSVNPDSCSVWSAQTSCDFNRMFTYQKLVGNNTTNFRLVVSDPSEKFSSEFEATKSLQHCDKDFSRFGAFGDETQSFPLNFKQDFLGDYNSNYTQSQPNCCNFNDDHIYAISQNQCGQHCSNGYLIP